MMLSFGIFVANVVTAIWLLWLADQFMLIGTVVCGFCAGMNFMQFLIQWEKRREARLLQVFE